LALDKREKKKSKLIQLCYLRRGHGKKNDLDASEFGRRLVKAGTLQRGSSNRKTRGGKGIISLKNKVKKISTIQGQP